MRLKSLLIACVGIFVFSLHAQNAYKIYPIPQQEISLSGTAKFTPTVNVVAESKIDQATKHRVQQVLEEHGLKAVFSNHTVSSEANILLGVNGSGEAADKSISKQGLSRAIFTNNKYDRQILQLTNVDGCAQLVVLGENTDATFYGLASLEQMMDEFPSSAMPCVTIYDYADVKTRGVIEGYYGMPYTVDVTKDLFRFMMRFKMNTYMYGAKSDPYHSKFWGKPYPTTITEDQRNLGFLTQDMLRDITKVSHETKVNFIWAIHPGGAFTDKNNTSVINQIMNKFESMYGLGVRQFGVFVDDIGVPNDAPTLKLNADRLTELQNAIDKKWNVPGVSPADTVKPLHFVPQLYAYSWANEEGRKKFFGALGKTPSKVVIYFTGSGVWTVPNTHDCSLMKGYLGREMAWWWNYPCNDNDHEKLFPMDMYSNFQDEKHINGNDRLAPQLDNALGVISNPMQQGEVSKIVLFSIADYCWNTKAFRNIESWNASFPYIVGKEKAKDYQFLAHYLRFFDKESIGGMIENFKSTLRHGVVNSSALEVELSKIVESCKSIEELKNSSSESDRLMYEDMKPWLLKLDAMAGTALNMVKLAQKPDSDPAKWEGYVACLKSMKDIAANPEYTFNMLVGLGSGISTQKATARPSAQALYPFLDWLKNHVYSDDFLSSSASVRPMFVTNVDGATGNPLNLRGRCFVTTSRAITLAKGQYAGMELTQGVKLKELNLADSLLENYTVIYSSNGKQWKKLVKGYEIPKDYVKYIVVSNEGKTPKSLRLKMSVLNAVYPEETKTDAYSIPQAPIYENHDKQYMTDGDYNTYVCIKRNQQNGDAYVVALRKVQPVNDVRIGMGTTNGDYMNTANVQVSLDGANWRTIPIKSTNNANFTMEVPQLQKYSNDVKYCDFDGHGGVAKYVRLLVVNANVNKWLRLYEIEVNKQSYLSRFQGNATDLDGNNVPEVEDGKMNTSMPASVKGLIYRFKSLQPIQSVTLYQDPSQLSGAKVEVSLDGEKWMPLTNLSEAKQVIDLSSYPYAVAIKITWDKSQKAPAIYEIVQQFDKKKEPMVTSLQEIRGNAKVNVYVKNDVLSIQSYDKIRKVSIYALDGKLLSSENYNRKMVDFPLRGMEKDVKIVKILLNNGKQATCKICAR